MWIYISENSAKFPHLISDESIEFRKSVNNVIFLSVFQHMESASHMESRSDAVFHCSTFDGNTCLSLSALLFPSVNFNVMNTLF